VQRRWLTAGWDVGAFAGGLALAWWQQWQARDLIWSLWLSSLVVGYSSILWSVGRLAAASVSSLLPARGRTAANGATTDGPTGGAAAGVIVFAVFLLGFFTFHFGMFHFVHSVFLNTFFPVDGTPGFPSLHAYATVVRRYWSFLPAAFVAERAIFVRQPSMPRVAASRSNAAQSAMDANNISILAPYRQVIQMQLTIFLLIGAAALHFDNFRMVAMIYAVYFFPWSLLRRRPPDIAAGRP
jgi:hypothetical protein